MDEKSVELDGLKADKAKAEAERNLARKQVEHVQAELHLAKIDPISGAKAAAEALTAISNAQRAQADAAVAAVNAQVTAEKAKFGSVNGATFGSITADTGAGCLEASLLSAEAIDTAAVRIFERLAPLKVARYVLFTGSQRPNFGDYRLFEVKIAAILAAYRNADAAGKEADEMIAASRSESPAVVAHESAAVTVTAAAASLDLISKFGSYFSSDYKFSPAVVSGVDADLLAVSLAGLLTGCIYPARWSPAPDDTATFGLLEPLTARRHKASRDLKVVVDAQRKATAAAAAESEVAKKEQFEELANQYQRAVEIYMEAGKAFDEFLTSLTEVDNGGIARMTRIAEQKAVADYLANDGLALLVQVGGVGATIYTQKNLWTFFGGAPFYVSGGVIASFLAVDRTGAVKAAGQERLHSGYLKVSKVAGILSPRKA
jgi:hypothetical protein